MNRLRARAWWAVGRATSALILAGTACSTRAPHRVIAADERPDRPAAPGRAPDAALETSAIRVALSPSARTISATTEFGWYAADGTTLLARARRSEHWEVERARGGSTVRTVSRDGSSSSWQPALVARVIGEGFLTVNGKRYRGELWVEPLDDSLTIVNRLALEDYLPAVVAVEMGNRPPRDSAALQAQAVAARSYAALRLRTTGRPFDVHASVMDQAYGGVDVENEGASRAVQQTRGLVLRYQGRLVDAPYSSTCGGSTAEPQEVWRSPGAAYLQRVSDRVDGSDRYYCDIAPRYRWTRTYSASELDATLARYLARYASVPSGEPGTARALRVVNRTPSGRVGTLELETTRGTFPLRGNDIRFVLRASNGEILNSTYFSVDAEHARHGSLHAVVIRGQGYGHGIGMCQWGAIGRSRAGHSYRSILATYYPGTTVGLLSVQ